MEDSVAYPLHMDEFRDLPERTKKNLLRLMAKISEKSYRRGFHHGTLGQHTVDPTILRYNISLDKSPDTDRVGKSGKWVCSNEKSIDRLTGENGVLYDVGLHVPGKDY